MNELELLVWVFKITVNCTLSLCPCHPVPPPVSPFWRRIVGHDSDGDRRPPSPAADKSCPTLRVPQIKRRPPPFLFPLPFSLFETSGVVGRTQGRGEVTTEGHNEIPSPLLLLLLPTRVPPPSFSAGSANSRFLSSSSFSTSPLSRALPSPPLFIFGRGRESKRMTVRSGERPSGPSCLYPFLSLPPFLIYFVSPA